MVVRELIALLGIDVNDRDLKKVDTAVSRFEGRMQKVAKVVGGSIFVAGLARAGLATVKLASDVREEMNVINQVFAGNVEQVKAWASTTAGEVGRSEFALRRLASQLGAVINPLMLGNSDAAAEMSTTLAKLAVDLSSFFNITEDEALVKLLSGIVGETESIKELGVVMTEVNLKAFAMGKGLNFAKVKADQAAITQLRYEFILANTVSAQGDAARTSEEYANASRAAADAVRDLATRIGDRLLPMARRFLVWARDTTRDLIKLSQQSNILEAGLIALGGSLAALAILMVAPFLPFLVTAAKVTAAIVGIALVTDELITFFKGGKTVLGEFIDELFGVGAAQELVDNLNAGWQEMADWWQDLIEFGADLHRWVERIGEALDNLVPKSEKVRGALSQLARAIPGVALFQELGKLLPEEGPPDVPRATRRGVEAPTVAARRGSTGRDVRAARIREIERQARQRDLQGVAFFGPNLRERLELRRLQDRRLLPETRNERRWREERLRRSAERRRREIQEERVRRSAEPRADEQRRQSGERHRRAQGIREAERQLQTTFTLPQIPAPVATPQRTTRIEQRIEPKVGPFIINEAADPREVQRAIRLGVEQAIDDAGAALAEGGK